MTAQTEVEIKIFTCYLPKTEVDQIDLLAKSLGLPSRSECLRHLYLQALERELGAAVERIHSGMADLSRQAS